MTLHLAGGQKLPSHHVLGDVRGAAQTLLDHIRAELVAGQHVDLAAELAHKRLCEGRLIQVDDVLNNVVAEGVLHETEGILSDLGNQPHLLLARGVINASLKDAAAVAVSANLDATVADRAEDELGVGSGELV